MKSWIGEKERKPNIVTQSRRVLRKKSLRSETNLSKSSKCRLFLSLQIHHIKQCCTAIQIVGACLDNKKSSLNFRHSIFITHHSSLITYHSSLIFSHSFGNIIFIFITQFFHTIHGSHTCQLTVFFFFFNTQLTEANIIKKKKKKLNGQPRKRKEKKKKKHKQPTPTQEKKKKKKKTQQPTPTKKRKKKKN